MRRIKFQFFTSPFGKIALVDEANIVKVIKNIVTREHCNNVNGLEQVIQILVHLHSVMIYVLGLIKSKQTLEEDERTD